MSPRSPWLYLEDIRQACLLIGKFSVGKSLQDYEANLLLRSGLEHQLTIIGESMRAVIRFDPSLAGRLPESSRMIGFRNVRIHHYFEIEDEVVWIIVTRRVPELAAAVDDLIETDSI